MRGGDKRTPEGLQEYLEASFAKDFPSSIEMSDISGKMIGIKNKDGNYIFLGNIILPEGDLSVFMDKGDIEGKIKAWLADTVPIAE